MASLLRRAYDALCNLVFPWVFMRISLTYLPGTILRSDFRTLTSWPRFQAAWFGAFWAWAGPRVRMNAEQRVVPLLEGRVHAGARTDAPVHPPVAGVVIEVGPGSGMWVDVFKDKGASGPGDAGADADGAARRRRGGGEKKGRVTKVYGVEPNKDVHPLLYKRIADAGLQGTYEVVPVGIESLNDPTKWDGKVEKESVDCIVSILCLCSIPDPERHIKELYGYLKPGGQWYVYEHVKVSRNLFVRLYQAFVNLIWPHFIGGCTLTRDTGRWLREAGPWTTIDLQSPVEETWEVPLPHVYGILTK